MICWDPFPKLCWLLQVLFLAFGHRRLEVLSTAGFDSVCHQAWVSSPEVQKLNEIYPSRQDESLISLSRPVRRPRLNVFTQDVSIYFAQVTS